MSLLAPAALGLLALSIPLLVLYMLRSRRQRLIVPSTLLWQGEEHFVAAAVPWQRLRITTLLVLQLLAIALFALLLARPFFEEETLLGPHTVVIVDTSGSMAAAGRLDAAVTRARTLVADASEANLVSIVDGGPRARVLAAFARDPVLLDAALDQLRPTGGDDDLAGAVRLARGLATPDRPTSLLILSDGGTAGTLPEPVGDARHLAFDATGDNLAITGFGTGSATESGTRVFVEVSSFAAAPARPTVELLVDGLSAGTIDLDLEPGEQARQVRPVDAGPGQVVTARLLDHSDALPLDDAASIVLSGGVDLAVTVLGEGSMFLDALLRSVPGVRPAVGGPPDVAVVDGTSAASVDRPSWIIAPSSPPPGVTVTGSLLEPIVTYQRPGEPLLEGLDLSDLAVAEAQIVDAPGWLPLLRADEVPLVLLGDVDGQRSVYFTFDLTRSNLPVQVSFPVLGARILDWLGGGRVATAGTAPAGTPLTVAAPAGSTAVITLPDGSAARPPAGTVLFTDTGEPGVYRVDYEAGDGTVIPGFVAARQFVATESPGATRSIAVAATTDAAAGTGTLLREWAPFLLAGLLLLVLTEWWVAYGRPRPWRRRLELTG
jgi:Ca-activated chloride channel homolog